MAFLAQAVTSALDVYVNGLWANGVKTGLDQVFPKRSGFIQAVLYALVITIGVIVIRKAIEYIMEEDDATTKLK